MIYHSMNRPRRNQRRGSFFHSHDKLFRMVRREMSQVWTSVSRGARGGNSFLAFGFGIGERDG